MIDEQGFRPNVGIILINHQGRVFWARRARGGDAWQFPQGGIQRGETPKQAMYRELMEETGLAPEDVSLLGCTRGWLRYRLPNYMVRHHIKPVCIGQKQKWFMLRMQAEDSKVRFDRTDGPPEFDHWRWISYWQPMRQVIFFKRRVYKRALEELKHIALPQQQQAKQGNKR